MRENPVVKDEQGNITKYVITIELTPEEYKAMAWDCDAATYTNWITGEQTRGVEAWIQNAVHNKARQCVDALVTNSGEGSKFTAVDKKVNIIKQMIVETATEKMTKEKAKETK